MTKCPRSDPAPLVGFTWIGFTYRRLPIAAPRPSRLIKSARSRPARTGNVDSSVNLESENYNQVT
jgi:hypothetical protein